MMVDCTLVFVYVTLSPQIQSFLFDIVRVIKFLYVCMYVHTPLWSVECAMMVDCTLVFVYVTWCSHSLTLVTDINH